MKGWRSMLLDSAPPWMRGAWVQRLIYAVGLTLDEIQEFYFQARNARFPTLGTVTAYPLLAKDRGTILGPEEPDVSRAARLVRYLDDKRILGSPLSILAQLRAYLSGHVFTLADVNNRGSWYELDEDGELSILRQAGNWDWAADPPEKWSKFWIILRPADDSLWTDEGTWGDASTWGEPGTWGSTATLNQIASLRRIIKTKTAGTTCVWIILALDPSSFASDSAPGAPMPDGTWAYWGVMDTGVRRPSRLASARYIDGTNPRRVTGD